MNINPEELERIKVLLKKAVQKQIKTERRKMFFINIARKINNFCFGSANKNIQKEGRE